MNKLGKTYSTQAAHLCSALVHPAVLFAYFALLVLVAMLQMQPVLIVLSWALTLAQGVLFRGAAQVAKSLRWQLPLVLVITLANPLFVAAGSTELFRIGLRAIYAESLLFGACMGLMLSSMFVTFANAGSVISRDAVLQLFGGMLPTIGLMISMIVGLMPRLLRQSSQVNAVQEACTSARAGRDTTQSTSASKRITGTSTHYTCAPQQGSQASMRSSAKRAKKNTKRKHHLRLLTVLMSWSLENSLDTADAMKVRGWGAVRKRSTYSRQRFESFDALLLAVVLVCAVVMAGASFVACSDFTFYPSLSGWVGPLWYLPFIVFCGLPFVLVAALRIREAS